MYWLPTFAVMPLVCLGARNFAHHVSVHAARPSCKPSRLDRNLPHVAGDTFITRVLTTPQRLPPARNEQRLEFHRGQAKTASVQNSVSRVRRGLGFLNKSPYTMPWNRKPLPSGKKTRRPSNCLSTAKSYQSSTPTAEGSLTKSEKYINAAVHDAAKGTPDATSPIAINNTLSSAAKRAVEVSTTQKILKRDNLQPFTKIDKNRASRFWNMINRQILNADANTVGRSTRTAPKYPHQRKQTNAADHFSQRLPKRNPIDPTKESLSTVRNIVMNYSVDKVNGRSGKSRWSAATHYTNYDQVSCINHPNHEKVNSATYKKTPIFTDSPRAIIGKVDNGTTVNVAITGNNARINGVANLHAIHGSNAKSGEIDKNVGSAWSTNQAEASTNINGSRTRDPTRTQTDVKRASPVSAAPINAMNSFLRKTQQVSRRFGSLLSDLKVVASPNVGVALPQATTTNKGATAPQSLEWLRQVSEHPSPNTNLEALDSASASRSVPLAPRALQSLNLSPSPRTSSTRVASLATLPDWVSDPSWVGHMRSRREKWAAPSAAQEAANIASRPEYHRSSNGLLSSWSNHGTAADDGFLIAEDLEVLTTKVLRTQQQNGCLKSRDGCINVPGEHMSTINGTRTGTDWKTPGLQQLRTLPFRVAHRAYERYRPLISQRIIQSAQGTVLVGNNGAQFFRNSQQRISRLGVGAVGRSVAGGLDVNREITEFNTQWKKFTFGGLTSALNHEILAGVGGPNGRKVTVDYSRDAKAGSVEVAMPNVQSATLADFTDHDYGQRIRVKNYEMSLRHDFDQFQHPDPGEYATELLLGLPAWGVAVATDLPTRRYGVSVGVKNYQVAVAHDFNARVSEVNAKWGKGWKLDVKSDLVDRQNHGLSAQVGFGLPDSTYLSVQGGLGSDGLPMGGVSVAHKKVKASVALVNSGGDEAKFIYNLNIGKYTFGAESQFVPGRILLPNLLGIKPQQLRAFIHKLLPSFTLR